MAKRSKNNKNLIIGICSAVAAVAVIVLVVVLIVVNSGLNDGYFKTDDSKYVFSVDTSELMESSDENTDAPVKIHEVFTHDGETITSHKYYYEYANADAAKNALDSEIENAGETFEKIEQDGKYIVLTLKEEDYKDLTASQVKDYYELFEKRKESEEKDDTDENEVDDEDDDKKEDEE